MQKRLVLLASAAWLVASAASAKGKCTNAKGEALKAATAEECKKLAPDNTWAAAEAKHPKKPKGKAVPPPPPPAVAPEAPPPPPPPAPVVEAPGTLVPGGAPEASVP